jgi:hypothetical protein
MEHGNEGMKYGIEVFRANGWKNNKVHSLVGLFAELDVIGPAINGHGVTSRDQPNGKFFGEGFKPAVVCRNPAGSENGQFHLAEL